eukprot:Gb_09560 [translate_table: standard]
MENGKLGVFIFIMSILALILVPVYGFTNQQDVSALINLYTSLKSPSQLTGWNSSGTDPCGQSWQGVTCTGSAVTAIKLSGLGLTGQLGYQLTSLSSLTILDLSNNNIQGNIPYQLPTNLTYLNLAGNSLGSNLPYSLSSMASLTYLNVSHNSLSSLEDFFGKLLSLNILDISFNSFSDGLPQSFSLLSNLSVLHMQNNQLTGPINVLANLPLTDLNIENNHFNGWIPKELDNIPIFQHNGNSFSSSPAPPPPPYTPPPPSNKPGSSHNTSSSPAHKSPSSKSPLHHSKKQGNDKAGLSGGAIAGIVIGGVLAAAAAIFVIIFFAWRSPKRRHDEEKISSDASLGPLPPFAAKVPKESSEQKIKGSPPAITLKPPPSERHKPTSDKGSGRMSASKRAKSPITAIAYSIADLQMATNSFSQENLVGEGAFGRVYKAEFPNGKILAVKKIDSSALSLQKDEDFLEAVSNMSRLRHPNITELVGYCTEHGQCLLVYEYFGNGTLHDILHFAEDCSKRLTWNTRVRIALGTARALEYLHEVCLPSVVHRNFKSANILLDDELNPHLSDCGIAALTPSSERQVSTQMLGSFGYSAPEYAMSGIYTVKSDVYSFGVVMLELLTGRKPLDSSRPRSEQSLVRWATPQLHDIDALAKMVDQALKGIYPAKSLSRFADIIALCVQPEPEFRPPMSEVVQALVRLMQRASLNKRRSGDESGASFRPTDHDPSDSSI